MSNDEGAERALESLIETVLTDPADLDLSLDAVRRAIDGMGLTFASRMVLQDRLEQRARENRERRRN